MMLVLKRWRHWLSPTARQGRNATRDYFAWAEAQRDMHSRARKTAPRRR
jgi:hypothetical protein